MKVLHSIPKLNKTFDSMKIMANSFSRLKVYMKNKLVLIEEYCSQMV